MNKLKISELNIYPIKSSAQVSLDFSLIDRFGLQDDRRWMIVDQENTALTTQPTTDGQNQSHRFSP